MKEATGLVKLKENNVRSGGDIAMGAAGAAATGAQMGSSFGPYGALVGGGIGAIAGIAGGLAGKEEEERRLRKTQTYNKGVGALEGRGDNSQLYTMQARYGAYVAEDGMNSTRYSQVESEKGEQVFDKNWNLLHNFDKESAPTHEEIDKTGDKSTTKNLPEGATVVPKKDLSRVKSLVKRYKLRGDKKAEGSLNEIRDNYKTTEEAMGKAQDGIYNIPGDKKFDYSYQGGKWMTRPYGADSEFEDMYSNNRYKDGIPVLEKRFGLMQQGDTPAVESRDVFAGRRAAPIESTEQSLNPNTRQGSIYEAPYTFSPSGSNDTITDTPGNTEAPTASKTRTGQGISKGLDALKYVSTINNLYQGLQPAEQVNRRFYTPDDLEYKDMSKTQRRAVTESRNATNRATRGKGLSAGQQQSYATQTGARYRKAMEGINEREAQRYQGVRQFNSNQRNRARQTNLELANRYDMQDEQADAVRQKYFDTALAETSEFAQIGQQGRNMKRRNEKQDARDQQTLGFLNEMFPNFSTDGSGVDFRKGFKK